MESQFPLVTIITPAYNRASFLDETIQSILSQNYPNIEYIVLDDGSKDNTKEVVEKYQSQIVFELHTNMGETRTVNKGFEMARGDIIGVINSDDPLLPDAIRSIVEFMQSHPNIGIVYPDWDYIDADGKKFDHIQTFEYSYINMLRWHHCMPGPGTFFRREICEKLDGRDSQFRYVGDFDFWLRAGLITEFARLPKTLATFRMHPNSASASQTNERMAEEHITLINKIFALPGLTADALKYKREAYSSAYYIAGCVCQFCDTKVRRNYFMRAIRYAPLKYLGEYRSKRLMEVIIPISFPWIRRIYPLLQSPLNLLGFMKAKIKTALKAIKTRFFHA
jgi:glycosyltransferase involved in cell wall biosynthesis